MRRRINWKLGDSAPASGNIVSAVSGTGTLKITTGFPVSGADVAFAKAYEASPEAETYLGGDPEVFVSAMEDDGFVVTYLNIPDVLNINYFAM